MFSCKICEIYKNTFFEEQLGTAASFFNMKFETFDKKMGPNRVLTNLQASQLLAITKVFIQS